MSSRTAPAVVATLVLALVALVTGREAVAGPKKGAGGCSAKAFPIAVGNTWTFVPGQSPTVPPESMVRFIPIQAKQVVVKVLSIDTKDGKQVATLEEDVDGRKTTSTISCDGKFEVSPGGFFFAGEPGGYFGINLENVQRTVKEGTPWAVRYREDLTATFKRVPTKDVKAELGGGKLEIERVITQSRDEAINAPFKAVSAHRYNIEITGRVTLDGSPKPSEFPANVINTIWFADGVGPVQVYNNYFQLYQLQSFTKAGK